RIGAGHAEQHQQATADLPGHLVADPHPGAADALHDGTHVLSAGSAHTPRALFFASSYGRRRDFLLQFSPAARPAAAAHAVVPRRRRPYTDLRTAAPSAQSRAGAANGEEGGRAF